MAIQKYKLSNGSVVPVPEETAQAFLLEIQSKGLTAELITDESESTESGENQEAGPPPNNQQKNTQSESTEPEYYEYGTDEQSGSYGKTYMPSPAGEGYEWLDTKGQYYKDESGTVYHENLDGQVTAFGGEDEYMQHRESLGLPRTWTGIGDTKNKDVSKLNVAKTESKEEIDKQKREEATKKLTEFFGTPFDPEGMSTEDLLWKAENPLSEKVSESNEVITHDAEGVTVSKDGVKVEKEDYSTKAKKKVEEKEEFIEETVKSSKGEKSTIFGTEIDFDEDKIHKKNDLGDKLYSHNGSEITEEELYDMYKDVIPGLDHYGDDVWNEFMRGQSSVMIEDPQMDDEKYMEELREKKKNGTITQKEEKELRYFEDEIKESNRPPLVTEEVFEEWKEQMLTGGQKFFWGKEKEFETWFDKSYGWYGFSSEEATAGKNVIKIISPPDENGNTVTSEKINLNDPDYAEKINNFVQKHFLHGGFKKQITDKIEKIQTDQVPISEVNAENKISGWENDVVKQSEFFEKLEKIKAGTWKYKGAIRGNVYDTYLDDDGMVNVFIRKSLGHEGEWEKMTREEYLSQDPEQMGFKNVWKDSKYSDVVNNSAFKDFLKTPLGQGYVPQTDEGGGDFADMPMASKLEKFLKDLQNDDITEKEWPGKQEYKKEFEKILNKKREEVETFIIEKNKLDPNSPTYKEDLAKLDPNGDINDYRNSALDDEFQDDYSVGVNEQIVEYAGGLDNEVKGTVLTITDEEKKKLNYKQLEILEKKQILSNTFKPVINEYKDIQKNIRQNQEASTEVYEQAVKDGIMREVVDEKTGETTYEYLIDENYAKNLQKKIYKENGIKTTQAEYNQATEKIVKDNPIVINGETITPGQEGFDVGANNIINKYTIPSKEEVTTFRNNIQAKINNKEITHAKGSKQWQEYVKNIEKQEVKLNEELQEYETEYKRQAANVNALLTEFDADQNERKSKADKQYEEKSKSVLTAIDEFKSKFDPLKIEYEELLRNHKIKGNAINNFFKLDNQYVEELKELGLDSVTNQLLAAEGMRQLDSGFTAINLAVGMNKQLMGLLDFAQQGWDLGEDVGRYVKRSMINMFGEDAGGTINTILDGINAVGTTVPGILFDKDSPLIKNKATDQYGWHQSFVDELGDRQAVVWADWESQTRIAPKLTEATTGEEYMDAFSQGLVDFAPSMVLMYTGAGLFGTTTKVGRLATAKNFAAGMLLPAMSASGNAYTQYENELDLYQRTYGNYGHNHTMGHMVTASLMVGITESASEAFDFYLMKGVGKYVKSTYGSSLKAGFRNNLSRLLNPIRFGKATAMYGVNSFASGGSEWLAELGNNAINKYMMGHDVHMLENTDEMFWQGASIGMFMQTPKIFADVMSPFLSSRNKKTVQDYNGEMVTISEQIIKEKRAKNPDVDKIKDLEKQFAETVSKSSQAIQEDLKRIDLLHPTEKKVLVEIDKRNAFDRKKIREIQEDNSLTLEQRTNQITDLASKIETRNQRKQKIIDKYPPEVVNANYSAQVEVLKETAELAKKMGGPNVKIRELSQDEFSEQVKKYESDQRGMSSQQVEEAASHFEGMAEGLNEVINDPDASSTEIQAAQELINDANNKVNLANNILNNSDYGVMQPKYDNKGRIKAVDILINKDSSIKDGMFNTAAHEFVHAAFSNTLKSDPAMRQVLGGQLQDIFDNDANVEFAPGKKELFNKRVNSYHPDVRGEEALAIASEMMADGDIKFKDGPLKDLGGIFRRFGQFYLGHDIKFDNKNDIKNFLKDYHKSLKTHKPNPAIARMMAKGANGKIFRDARTPAERKNQAMHNKAVQQNMQSNTDLLPSFDNLVKFEDGSPRFNNHQDFKTSPEFIEGYDKIVNSKLLDGLIKQGMTEKGLPPGALNDFTRKVKEQIGDRYLTNFDLNKNNSLFGWLTGVSGGAGMSIIYRAKGDVMKQYTKEGRAKEVSIDKPIGEAGTIADLVKAEKDSLIEQIENADMTPVAKRNLKVEAKGLKMVMEMLGFPNNVKNSVNNTIKESNIPLEDLSYKNIRDLLLSTEGKITTEKKAVPTGPLFRVLNAISSEVGVDPLRILAKQDLNAEQRKNAQSYIYDQAVNEDGSFNTNLIDILPEGQDRSGKATGVANTKLGQFYTKGGRAKMKAGATAAGLAVQNKRTDITKDEFLDLFGINSNGSFQPGTKADGAIRELTTQIAQLAANQGIRLNAIENNLAAADVVARLKDGTSTAMYNKKKPTKSEAQQIAELAKEYFNTDPKKYLKHQVPTIRIQKDAHVKKYGYDIKKLEKKRMTIIDDGAASPWNPGITMKQEKINALNDFLSIFPEFRELIKSNSSGGIGLGMLFTKYHAETLLPAEKGKQDYIPRNHYVQKSKDKSKNRRFNEKVLNKKDDSKQRLDLLYRFSKAIESHLKTGKNPKPQRLWFFTQLASDTVNNQAGGITRILSPFSFWTTLRNGITDTINIMVEEHAGPQKRIMNLIVNAARTGTIDKVWPLVEAIYAQGPILETFDTGLKNIKNRDGSNLEESLPDIFWDKIAAKILNGDFNHFPTSLKGIVSMVRYAVAGGDLNTIKWKNGKTVTENFGIGIKGEASQATIEFQNDLLIKYLSGEITQIKMQNDFNKFLNSKVKNENLNSYLNKFDNNKIAIDNSKNLQNQILTSSNMLSSKRIPKVKGMSTFDFDDTLAMTKSGVQYTMPNNTGEAAPQKKVIFLAGGPGSGKSSVVKQLGLEEQGFKIVNQDISLQWLAKNHGLPTNMNDFTPEQASKWSSLQWEARDIAKRKKMKFQGNGDGVIIDGTGASRIGLLSQMGEFKRKGYDAQMVFVETDLKVALARNKARKERSLKNWVVVKTHKSVQENKKSFKENFGDNFIEVNTNNLKQGDPMPVDVASKVAAFTTGYIKGRITAEEFANQGSELLEQGAEFDFSEFNKVVEGQPGPYLQTAINRAKKFGTKDIFVLTARPQASARAIQTFLMYHGLNIPIKNITGLANSTGQAKANWMLEKFAEGYNDMYFVDDAFANVAAVKKVLNQLDIKSDVVQAKLDKMNRLVDKSDSMKSKIIEPDFENTVNQEFNEMLERKKGVDADKIISQAEAKRRGSETNIARFFKNLYIPPSAEDFKGLMYYFVGKGKQGDADLKFFKEKLFDPFAKGIRDWNSYKQNMVNEYKALKKKFPEVSKSLNKKIPGTVFTNDTAIRTYLFDKAGHEIPGLSMQQKRDLNQHVKNNPDLQAFADGLSIISRSKDGYPPPTENWSISSIPGDMNNLVSKVGRKQFLQDWVNMKNNIFNEDNLNKIEATYGNWFREALDNILYRMENGGNRLTNPDSTVDNFTRWINGSVGAIMFFNMRSALLQTISTVNFINWSDNNMFKASAAFANQPQFWKDFVTLFNSDQLKQRRKGLQTDVSASELTKSFAEGKATPTAVIAYLLQKGFTPTQVADSFAIAFGGASFYRNRLKKYIKEGMNAKQANEQAMLDFQEIAEETQQSSREDLVSQQQASVLGRIVLAFQNVTMQMGRLTKKAMSDLINGRGDWKTNVSKIVYYGMVQNLVFASLQTALAFMMWGDDEEVIEDKTRRTFNQALDSFLRGTGLYGALLSTFKNTAIQWNLQKDKPWGKEKVEKIILEAISLSPPIGAKLRKLASAYYSEKYNEGIDMGLRVDNPQIKKWATLIEATTNLPLARIMNKANNLEEALTGDHLLWQRAALILGWNRWDIGVKDKELEEAKIELKEKKKEEKDKIKEEKKKEDEKKKEEEENKEEERKKEEGIKTVQCSGIRSNGQRCGNKTETKKKSWKCVHHAEFKDGSDRDGDGKPEYRCTATKSNGQRCKNKTENTNKKCYAHQ